MHFKKRGAAVVLAGTALLLSACSSPSSTNSLGPGDASSDGPRLFDTPVEGAAWARDNGYELMAAQLDDGIVTPEEYEVAYSAQISCRELAGWTYDNLAPVWNPIDHLKLVRRGEAPPAPDAASETACNEQFDYIDFLFQTTATPRMDQQLLSAVQGCLELAEVSFSAEATSLPELVGPDAGSSRDADAIAACVSDETTRLYPDLPGLSIAF